MNLNEISIGDFVAEKKQGKTRYGKVRAIIPNDTKNKVQLDFPDGTTMRVNPNRLFPIESKEILNKLKNECLW